MITAASGRPIPNDQPMINASAKSKPTPARNSCHDMPLLLQTRDPRITQQLLHRKIVTEIHDLVYGPAEGD
jgi:hypothetical protein